MGFWGAQHPIDFIQACTYNLVIELNVQLEEDKMDELWLILSWGSPIGLGIGLALIGTFVWLLAKADEKSKRTKAFAREQGLEKKKE